MRRYFKIYSCILISASLKEAFLIAIIPAMRKQGTPLCSKNFVKAIFQTKKKSRLFFITLLCGKSAAPHHLASQGASPRGEALKKADNFQQARGKLFYFYNIGYEKIRSAPHHRLSGGASPRGEALKRRSLLLEQKNRTRYAPHQSTMLTASPRGEAAKRLTIFAEKNEGTEFSAGKGKMRSG